MEGRRSKKERCEDVKEEGVVQTGSNANQEKNVLQKDFGGLREKTAVTDKFMQAECLESPSCINVFPGRDHSISVHWKPVKHPAKIEGYKVVISTDDRPWKLLCYSLKNKCATDVDHKGSAKIGVCSYKGEKESDVVYIETEINAEAGKQKVSKKLHPKDSSVQSNNGGHNSNCSVGRKESDSVCTEKKVNVQVGKKLVPEKLSSKGNSTQSKNSSHNKNRNADSNECFILSTANLKIKPLLYHKVLHTPVKLTLLPGYSTSKRYMHVVRKRYSFHLKEELVRQIMNSRDQSFGSYKTQVLVRFFLINSGVIIHEDVLPDFIIRVNGDLALAKQKFEVHGGPLDITGLCNFNEGRKCDVALQIEWLPSFKMNYCVMVCVAEKLDIPDLVAMWLVDNVRHASKTRQMIQDKLNFDKDVSCTILRINLTCPLGKGRIVSPCRGENCAHIQCVDAVTLLKMNEGRPLSGTKCYLCDKPTGRIYIDGLFLDILSSVPDTVDKIEFRHDGSWTYLGQDDSSVKSKNGRQNEHPWNESKEAFAESSDEIAGETQVFEKDSEENVILDKVKSRLSEIKTQLNQLEVLSKLHEQCNVDPDREHANTADDRNIIDLSDEDDKIVSSVENISEIQDGENIVVDLSEDEDEKIVSIVKSIRNQTQSDAEKRERILENEISRILKEVKESAQEKKLGETVLPAAVSDGNVIDKCEGQVHEKAALEKMTDVVRRTNCTKLGNSTWFKRLKIGKTGDSLENSRKLRDSVRTKRVETTKVMNNDQGDKSKDGIRQFRHNSSILRMHLEKIESQPLKLTTQDCDVAENDLNSVNSEMKAHGSELGLFKPDGTAVHQYDLNCLESDNLVIHEEKIANEKLQMIQTDSSSEQKLICSMPFRGHLLQVTKDASESYASLRQLKLKGSNDTEVEIMQVGMVRDHPNTTKNTKEKHLLSGSMIEEAHTSNTNLKTGNNENAFLERPKSQTLCYSQNSGSKDTGEVEEKQIKQKKVIIDKETDLPQDYVTRLVRSDILKAKHAMDLAPPTKNQMKMAEVGIKQKFSKKHGRVFNDKCLRYPSRTFHSKTLENLYTRNISSWQKGGLQCNLEFSKQEEIERDEMDFKNENQEKSKSCDAKLIESLSEKMEDGKLNEEPLREKREEGKLNEEPLREKTEEGKLNKEPLRKEIEEDKVNESQEQVDSLQGDSEELDTSVDGSLSELVNLACSLTTYKSLKIEDIHMDSPKRNAISAEFGDRSCDSGNGNQSFEDGVPVMNVRSKTRQTLKCKKSQMLCPYCGKLFRTYRVYHTHLYSHTGVKPFLCEVAGCKQRFLSKILLKRHQLVHTTCIYCKKHFQRKDYLERHLKTHERNWSPWVCDLCGKEHSYSFSYKFHKAFHAADQNETLTCGLCDRVLESKGQLLSHLELHAGACGCIFCKDGDSVCLVCKNRFDTEIELTSNSNIHRKKIEFFCHLCKQKYGEIDNLVHHLQTEHSDLDQMTEKAPTKTVVSLMASQPKFMNEPLLNTQAQPMVLVPLQLVLPSLPKNIQEQLKQCTSGSSHSGNVSVAQAVFLSDQQYTVCKKPPQHYELSTRVTDSCKQQNSTHTATASANTMNPQKRMPLMQNRSSVQYQPIEKGFVPDSCQGGQANTSKFQIVPNITDKPLTQGLQDSRSVSQNQQSCLPQMHEQPNIQQKSLNTVKIEPLDVEKATEEQFITIQPLSSLARSDASSVEQNNRAQVFMACSLDSRHKSLHLKKSQGEEVTHYNTTLKRKRKLKPRETTKRHVCMKASVCLKRNKEFDIKDYKIYV